MKKGNQVVEVIEHIILRNFWEYYVLNEKTNTDDIKFCLVMGDVTEMGDVSMQEISPYIISKKKVTKSLDIMPVPGWEWM